MTETSIPLLDWTDSGQYESTELKGPSVIQVRGKQTLPEDIAQVVIGAIPMDEDEFIAGALVVIEKSSSDPAVQLTVELSSC